MLENIIPSAVHSTNLHICICERAALQRTLRFLYTDTLSSLMTATLGYYRPLLDISLKDMLKRVSLDYSIFPTMVFIVVRFCTIVPGEMFWKGKLNEYETDSCYTQQLLL